jgi:hypothetical protein
MIMSRGSGIRWERVTIEYRSPVARKEIANQEV